MAGKLYRKHMKGRDSFKSWNVNLTEIEYRGKTFRFDKGFFLLRNAKKHAHKLTEEGWDVLVVTYAFPFNDINHIFRAK